MGFIVKVTARGLDRAHWIDGRDEQLGTPSLLPRREDAMIFPTRQAAQRGALEVIMFQGSSVRYLILEEPSPCRPPLE
jgi:hypothetical protein